LKSVGKSSSNSETKPLRPETTDPVLSMLGVGKQLWQQETGDLFVERIRAEDSPPSPFPGRFDSPQEDLPESVWQRVRNHQGEEFRTATKLPFTYEIEGAGIWFFREGRRVNRKLSRAQFDEAVARCPLTSTTEIKDLIDYPYLFALLTDARIRGEAW
jgi:hypothetical protein